LSTLQNASLASMYSVIRAIQMQDNGTSRGCYRCCL